MRNRRPKVASPEECTKYPLHVKPVEPIKLHKVRQNMIESASQRLDDLMRMTHYNPDAPAYRPSSKFSIPERDAELLVQAGIQKAIGTVDTVDLTQYNLLRYFSVKETKTVTKAVGDNVEVETFIRRRGINWPFELLKISKYVSQHHLKSVDQYRQLACNDYEAATFDLQASYHQICLPPEAKMIMVSESGVVYQMLRLPYGHDAASEIMHMIVSTLAGDPRYAKPIPGINAADFDKYNAVHIDNVLISGPHGEARRNHFLGACKRCNVSLNVEPGNAFAWKQTFVGMQLDFANSCVSLKKGYGEKIELDDMRTCEDLERVMGKVLYAGAVLGVNWRNFLFLLKQYRRILALCGKKSTSWTEECRLWPVAREQLNKLVEIIRQNTPVKVTPSVELRDGVPHAILACDATPWSFGGMLLKPGHLPVAFGGVFGSEININVAEATAALCLVDRFHEELRGLNVLVLIDNTTAIAYINRGIRERLDPHGIGIAIRSIATQNDFRLRLQYIKSEDNPADSVSRQLEPNHQLAHAVMTRAWGSRKTKRHPAWGRAAVVPAVR